MIRADDRTPEERRADLRADFRASIAAMTDAEIKEGLQIANTLLAHHGNPRAQMAVLAVAQRVVDLRRRVDELEEAAEDAHCDYIERSEKADY